MARRLAFQVFNRIDATTSDLFAKACNEHSHLGLDIDIFVSSNGGCVWNVDSIIKTLKNYKELHPSSKIRTYVYSNAFSAAMLLVLIADELYCADFARFSPFDPLISHDGFVISKRNVDQLSKVKTSDGKLEYVISEFNLVKDYDSQYFRDFLRNTNYSTNSESIFQLLFCPISHDILYTKKDLENVGITRTGPIPKDLISMFTTKTLEGKTLSFVHPPLPPTEVMEVSAKDTTSSPTREKVTFPDSPRLLTFGVGIITGCALAGMCLSKLR